MGNEKNVRRLVFFFFGFLVLSFNDIVEAHIFPYLLDGIRLCI